MNLQVLETFKGRTTSSNLCLCFVGGVDEPIPSLVVRLSQSTLFDHGERSLLFVRGNGHSAWPLVGSAGGRIRLSGGNVYGEAGRPLLRNAARKFFYGRGNSLTEAQQASVGTNVLARVRSQYEGEQPQAPDPQGE